MNTQEIIVAIQQQSQKLRSLEELITSELLENYLAQAQAGDWRAIAVLQQLERRFNV